MLRGMEAEIYATEGTARFLMENGVKSQILSKLGEGGRDAVTILREAGISLILNTPAGGRGRTDAASIRVAASANGVACVTTLQGSIAALRGVMALRESALDIRALQDDDGQSRAI